MLGLLLLVAVGDTGTIQCEENQQTLKELLATKPRAAKMVASGGAPQSRLLCQHLYRWLSLRLCTECVQYRVLLFSRYYSPSPMPHWFLSAQYLGHLFSSVPQLHSGNYCPKRAPHKLLSRFSPANRDH
jgi:hypothetical protein